MDETFHIHSHLSIVLNGQLLRVPSLLGQVPATATAGGCFYQIHNHDAAGRLHVEALAPVSYTLGSFFKIWGQPLSSSNVAGITACRSLPTSPTTARRCATMVTRRRSS